ncbi:MAG: hypothetical protein ACK58T_04960, partial [Phycisphaerae bacterium]
DAKHAPQQVRPRQTLPVTAATATAVWHPQTGAGAAFCVLATYGRGRRRRRVVRPRNLTAPTTARTVAAASGSACRLFLTHRHLPRHHSITADRQLRVSS